MQRPQQPRAKIEAQPKAQPEPHSEPEPRKPEPQSVPEPQSEPEPKQSQPKPREPEELRVETGANRDELEPDRSEPRGLIVPKPAKSRLRTTPSSSPTQGGSKCRQRTSPTPITRRQETSNLGRSILGGLQRMRSSPQPTSSRTFPTRARPFECAFDCVATGEPAAQI